MTNIIKNRNAAPAAFGSVLDQLFPKTVTTLLDDEFWRMGTYTASCVAPVNIREITEGYELELAAPGLLKSDFQLKIDGDTLTISYEPQDHKPRENVHAGSGPRQNQENTHARWIRREFSARAFQRHFELSDTIDRDKISAWYENGILFLTLPKKETVRSTSRQIDID